MLTGIFGFRFDLPEFIAGLLLGMLFLLLILRALPHISRGTGWLRLQVVKMLDSLTSGAVVKYRAELSARAGRMHMARALFGLEQIAVVPRLLAPPFPTDPQQTEPIPETSLAVLPNLSDWTYLSGLYAAPSLTVGELLATGKSVLITGDLGSGKSTALAYAAILTIQRSAEGFLPLLVHAADFRPDYLTGKDPLEALVQASQQSVSAGMVSRMPNMLRQAYRQGKAILLLDGLDEFPEAQLPPFATFIAALLRAYPGNRIVAAGPAVGYDGLAAAGLAPLAILPWTEYDLRTFFNKWSAAWLKAGKEAPAKKGMGDIDPALLNGWLAGASRGRTPAEAVARAWAAYAGDARGPGTMDALDVYLDRLLSGADRQSAEACATGWIAEGSGAFTERMLRRGTSIGSLVDGGMIERRPAGRLSFTFPVLGAYLAGRGLADTGIAPAAPADFWLPAEYALRWYAASGDVAPIVEERLQAEYDPLSLNLLACARWLPDAPAKATWRANVLRGLAAIAQKDTQPYGLRLRCVHALAASYESSVAILFRRMAEAAAENTRLLGALGMGGLGDEETVKTLIKIANTDRSLLVRQAACLALGATGTDPALEGLGHVLLGGEAALQLAAAEALACQPEEGFNMLRDAMAVDNGNTRRAAVFGLARVPEPWALEMLEKCQVEDSEWVVRGAASEVVERRRRPPWKINPPAQELSEIPWLVAFAAREGLGIAPGKSSQEMLRRAITSSSLDESIAGLELAGWVSHGEFGLEIERAMNSGDPHLRDAAYEALWRQAAPGSSRGDEVPPP
ncbi:MAG: HEAT repeat domain-containing protein [Anaerolineales bacterium]|nr:HEAT repeat domain-containing protein [Anaerolineales bacterium]